MTPIADEIVYEYACLMLGYDSSETHRPPNRRELALARSNLNGEVHRHNEAQKKAKRCRTRSAN